MHPSSPTARRATRRAWASSVATIRNLCCERNSSWCCKLCSVSDALATGNDSRVTAESEPLLCPMCDYDLRGQVEPRCPECGYRFDFDELRDATRRLHPYLFEHHPKRNIRSFLETLLGGLRPKRFWTLLHPAQRSSPRRLALYFFIICTIALFPLAFHAIGRMAQLHQQRE